MKIILISVFFLFTQLSIAQGSVHFEDPDNHYSSSNNEISSTECSKKKSKDIAFAEKEWKKMQREIRKNKRKYSNYRDVARTSKKVLDTIYLNAINNEVKNTRLSDLYGY